MCVSNGVGNSAASSVSSSGIPGLCVGGKSTMSSVAVLTQESFAEHRSGLAQQQVKGEKRAEFPSCAFKHKRGSLLLPKLTPGIQFTTNVQKLHSSFLVWWLTTYSGLPPTAAQR